MSDLLHTLSVLLQITEKFWLSRDVCDIFMCAAPFSFVSACDHTCFIDTKLTLSIKQETNLLIIMHVSVGES